MTTVTASFDVTGWDPAGSDAPETGPELSRIGLEKTFTGAFEGTSTGEGLFCGMADPSAGAGYVVSERLTGQLEGRSGSFVVQHGGLMAPGEPPRSFGNIVPGSGTDELTGITGTMEIGEDHTLTLTYELG